MVGAREEKAAGEVGISRTRPGGFCKCKGVSIRAQTRKEKEKNPAGRREEEEKKRNKSRFTQALFQLSRARLESQRGGGKSRLEKREHGRKEHG
jgi:hypothetical protein